MNSFHRDENEAEVARELRGGMMAGARAGVVNRVHRVLIPH